MGLGHTSSRRQALIHPLEKYFLWRLAMQKTDPSVHCSFFFLILSHCSSHPICSARLFSHCSAGAEGLASCLAPQKPFPHWPHMQQMFISASGHPAHFACVEEVEPITELGQIWSHKLPICLSLFNCFLTAESLCLTIHHFPKTF